jgi:hypothetical protein
MDAMIIEFLNMPMGALEEISTIQTNDLDAIQGTLAAEVSLMNIF